MILSKQAKKYLNSPTLPISFLIFSLIYFNLSSQLQQLVQIILLFSQNLFFIHLNYSFQWRLHKFFLKISQMFPYVRSYLAIKIQIKQIQAVLSLIPWPYWFIKRVQIYQNHALLLISRATQDTQLLIKPLNQLNIASTLQQIEAAQSPPFTKSHKQILNIKLPTILKQTKYSIVNFISQDIEQKIKYFAIIDKIRGQKNACIMVDPYLKLEIARAIGSPKGINHCVMNLIQLWSEQKLIRQKLDYFNCT